ncbi:MAG: polysaccharide deacetylase family protein [Clostridia bacterium]|nr:polysaccharide deacetylase family protein [Clostridia bacterium]MDE7328313.1 polysaccharide deacetylase family protein [Clostridia bacterium]
MIYLIKKKSVISVVAILLLIVVCATCMANNDVTAVFNNQSLRKVPVYGVDTEEKLVALTFDAAWGADKTQGILDILEKHGVDGTFFLVGFWIDKYPEMVKAIAESGCDIGNHSKEHLNMSTLSKESIVSELDYVNEKVKELTDIEPKFFRPPFGDYNNALLEVVEEKNMIGIQWTVDSLDWKGLSAAEILSRVNSGVKSGSIILFHNNSDNILEALPFVIANLKNQGYKMVTLSNLVYQDNYTIDANGIQHKNQ